MIRLFNHCLNVIIALFIACLFCVKTVPGDSTVRVWEENMTIPTYLVDEPEVNPVFYTQESYQGAQKRIYPYALIERLSQNRQDKTYKALFLENEYIQLILLPEIGGRLFGALDKTNGYNFFYRQHVIKPALIGMLGAWISGGIEWCVFHHHRNTTFMPVDFTLAENPDGSKTIWFGETERRHRMKWIIGLTLHPGKSYVQATVKMFNPTAAPNSILYWANVAVHVNEDYQVIFPPSVNVATYHSKVDFTHWPISQGRYRGQDYTNVDISWWKNSPSSNSFFAWDLQEDFMGGYDHGKEAGVVHVSNHHVVCGAKLWEWGTGASGRRWDDILTDEDGPYAELMVGAFSDNQPDYSWIKPHEVKIFNQYWYPIQDIGGFKNANLNGAVNLDCLPDHKVRAGFHVTAPHENAKTILTAKDQILIQERITVSPDNPFCMERQIPEGIEETDLRISLVTEEGQELISYQPVKHEPVDKLPEPVKAPPSPEDIKTIEELYFTGLRVEQIHNPTVDPMIYYEEALKRDPNDSRTNIIAGVNYNKRGLYEKAEEHLLRASERITIDYTRPGNAEALYQLGIALRAQKRFDEAYDAFYRAAWDYAFHSAAYYQLAELSCLKGDYEEALEQIKQSLSTNALDTKALNLNTILLRKCGKNFDGAALVDHVLSIDPLNFIAMNEDAYFTRETDGNSETADKILANMDSLMRNDVQAYLECACDYMNAGFWDEAIDLLERAQKSKNDFTRQYPLVYYYLGYLHQQKNDPETAQTYYAKAMKQPSDYCFPFRLETIDVLNTVIAANPNDNRAYYYLGTLLYEIQPENAIAYWEKSRDADPKFALASRNLGWAYYRTQNDIPKAVEAYEQAVADDPSDPLFYLELDRLYELGNAEPERRLALFKGRHDVVVERKESFLREIRVLLLNGYYTQVVDYFSNYYFAAREGGENLHDLYADAHLLQGLDELKNGRAENALRHFIKAAEYPENLSVGQPEFDWREPQYAYFTGLAHEALGVSDKAKEFFEKAARQSERQGRRRGGRFGRSSDIQYYQGLSQQKLGREDDSKAVFEQMIENGKQRLSREDESIDYFAKFGEQNNRRVQTASAHLTLGLGLLGNGQQSEAKAEFEKAVAIDKSNIWARYFLQSLE
ncbi:MAG: DUF5107 domain-containing protein [Candidatus Omnitrophica bacterium]|nr:DUF5107 domain-containing protein [Candidatus Omnitrophota bacterium]